jgi:hypothetical protein
MIITIISAFIATSVYSSTCGDIKSMYETHACCGVGDDTTVNMTGASEEVRDDDLQWLENGYVTWNGMADANMFPASRTCNQTGHIWLSNPSHPAKYMYVDSSFIGMKIPSFWWQCPGTMPLWLLGQGTAGVSVPVDGILKPIFYSPFFRTIINMLVNVFRYERAVGMKFDELSPATAGTQAATIQFAMTAIIDPLWTDTDSVLVNLKVAYDALASRPTDLPSQADIEAQLNAGSDALQSLKALIPDETPNVKHVLESFFIQGICQHLTHVMVITDEVYSFKGHDGVLRDLRTYTTSMYQGGGGPAWLSRIARTGMYGLSGGPSTLPALDDEGVAYVQNKHKIPPVRLSEEQAALELNAYLTANQVF